MSFRGRVYTQIQRPRADLITAIGEYGVATLQAACHGDHLVGSGLRAVEPADGVPGRAAGPAVTAHNTSGDNLAMHVASTLTQPGDVLVLTSDGGNSAALWGELMTELALARGLAGVVVDGAIRDVAGIRRLGLPVWHCSTNPRTATKNGIGGVNVPVVLRDGVVRPGDIVVADEDGIVSIPPDDVEVILERAAEIEEEEETLRETLRTGSTFFEIAGLAERLEATDVEWLDGTCPLAGRDPRGMNPTDGGTR